MRIIYTTLLFAHVLGVVVWVGGMFVSALRGTAVRGTLQEPSVVDISFVGARSIHVVGRPCNCRAARERIGDDLDRRWIQECASVGAFDARGGADDDVALSTRTVCSV